ncbi:MAG TPA: MarR family transcriptional regulator [Paenibacillus sp.]|nr:MarR family transcriptional regulator [Paenibacillus sp.]
MSERALSLKLFVVLSKAYKAVMERTVKEMKKQGLSESEFTVLELLHHKGKFPLQRIGERLLTTSGGITYTIDKLEGKGLLRRVACPEDRRVTYAEITTEGSALMGDIFPAHAAFIEEMFQEVAPEEKRLAIELVKKIGKSAQR